MVSAGSRGIMFRNRTFQAQDTCKDNRRHTGARGESLAVKALKKSGYKIVERNYCCKLGEIDIIAREAGVTVFVEVKTRRTDQFGDPKLAVTPKKQRKISMVALDYLKRTEQIGKSARFDVVAIRLMPGQPDIEIIRNAFDLAY